MQDPTDAAGRRFFGPSFGRWLAFVLPLAVYLVVAVLLALHYHSYFGDAQAREANGFYVFFSRNPHLAAIGFVWNPGMSVADMPLILLKGLFPALVHEMLAANITSAVAMAGTCYQLYRFLEEQPVRLVPRWLILLAFALNPMIISYGGDGMSEALFMFFLVASTRHLSSWLRYRTLRPLVLAGVYLGLAYLVRNEAIAAAGMATVLVGAVTYLSDRRRPSATRRYDALTDMVIYAIPALAAFIGWALVSWIIVGHPFEQYQSAYGTASQIKFLGLNKTGGGKVDHFKYVAHAMWTAAPLIPALAVGALWRARKQRDPGVLAVIATLGSVCLFELAAYTTGQISWAYRYIIYVIPFASMLAGSLSSKSGASRWANLRSRLIPESAYRRAYLAVRPSLASILAVVLILPGVLSTGQTEFLSNIDPLDQQSFQWIVFPYLPAARRWAEFRREWRSVELMAQSVDSLHLGTGQIMVDTEEPCIPNLILQSARPTQFFIPNDLDFRAKIGSPYLNGVRYLIVSAPVGYGSVDALNVEYPSLYATGAGISSLAHEYKVSNCPTFRLYKLYPVS